MWTSSAASEIDVPLGRARGDAIAKYPIGKRDFAARVYCRQDRPRQVDLAAYLDHERLPCGTAPMVFSQPVPDRTSSRVSNSKPPLPHHLPHGAGGGHRKRSGIWRQRAGPLGRLSSRADKFRAVGVQDPAGFRKGWISSTAAMPRAMLIIDV